MLEEGRVPVKLQTDSDKVFTVSELVPRDLPVYKLKDYDSEDIIGSFYDADIQKIRECVKSELDLFTVPYTQTGIEKSIYVEVLPLSALSEVAPLEFLIPGNGEDYLDLNNTLLHVRCKIVTADGTNPAPVAKVAFVNYPIAGLFSQVDVILGDHLISQSSSLYPYSAIFKGLLNYSNEALNSQFAEDLFYKDTANEHENTALDGPNEGFKKGNGYTAQGKTVELLRHIHSDLFFQEKLIQNGVDVRIKMVQSKNEFCLMPGDAECYKVNILSANLFVKKVKVSAAVKLGHAHALTSSNAKYPVERVNMKVLSMPAGIRVCTQENLFLGQLPKYVVIGMVDNDAFLRDYARKPFNFKDNNVEFLALYLDGEQIPTKPFQPNFANDNTTREYYNLVLSSGKNLKDLPLAISCTDFSRGYTLFAFDLTPDQECGDYFSLMKTGNMRFEVCFRQPFPIL
ncbi:uncharacterized protein F54H12.2-like [Erpetoichthys calabaricus]|uniref:uncharacterized protein F54H12.2-like n=1 Tax=Erpetoichthys calabaricus TaxID=27687 RepID=UPI0010A06862|nr:uncharacterized protein F54H12.2-like [Erpetoichthys calabaricus]